MSRRAVNLFTRLASLRVATKQAKSLEEVLQRKTDLPSVEEFVIPHEQAMARRSDMKGMFTSDPTTISIAENILRKGGEERALSFFERNIFSQPLHSVSEKGSIKVKFSRVEDFPDFRKAYEESKDKDVMMSVGGPAAEDQVVIASIIPEIRRRLDKIIYLTRDYKESNVNHAAKQSHARHGNALNADENLTGHALLPKIMLRALLGISPEEAVEPDFRKVDVKFTIDPKKLRIYFGNELNWLIQEYRSLHGLVTEHDANRLESLLSQEILRFVEDQTQAQISGGVDKSIKDSSAVHVTFTQRNDEEVRHENEEFTKAGIEAERLSQDEITQMFGDRPKIYSAYKYPGDTHIKFDAHKANQDIATKYGADWIDGKEISRIFLTQGEDGNAKLAGVMTKDGEYIYVSRLHVTGGYKVDYEFDKDSEARFKSGSRLRDLMNKVEDILDLQRPLNNEITVSTGVSINAVFRKTDVIKSLIERFGSTGEIAVTNSHWTMIAENEDYVMVRMTGGGNTGSEEYNPAYFLNVLANTRRIFGDALIGVLSTYGCPRAINARNSTEFAQIAEGIVVSYGKGGTGNTKRHAEAASALLMLGFEEEVVSTFNHFQTRNGDLVGDELKKVHQQMAQLKFFHDNVEKTNRRMGFDDSISIEEIIALGILLIAVSCVIAKAAEKDEEKTPAIEEIPESAPFNPEAESLDNNKKVKVL